MHFPSGPNIITRSSHEESRKVREGDVTTKAEVRMIQLPALKMEEGQGVRVVSRRWKRQETDSPLESSEGMQP